MLHQTIAALLTSAVSLWQLPGLSQGERYIPVGTDVYNRTTVYLDSQSIEKTGSTSYKYTIFSNNKPSDTGKAGRFEEEIVVDCNQTGSITHLGTRLYDANGRLIKTDSAPGTQNVSARSESAPYRNANRTVCDRVR